MPRPAARPTLAALLAVAALAPGCRTARPDPRPAARDAVPTFAPVARARLVVIGDSGRPGADMVALHDAIAAEEKDAVLVLGDLVFPVAPACPDGTLHAEGRRVLDSRVGLPLRGLGAPALLALGNDDVAGAEADPARVACLVAYAAEEADLVLPARAYAVDLGAAVVAIVDTNALDREQAELVRAAFAGHPGWKVLAGHHPLRVYGEHEDEEEAVARWLARHDLRPDVYLNGHAHTLQLGVYGGVVAVTSGATAEVHDAPACPPECGEGQRWGRAVAGYAVVTLGPGELDVAFHDAGGRLLHAWRSEGAGRAAPAAEEAP